MAVSDKNTHAVVSARSSCCPISDASAGVCTIALDEASPVKRETKMASVPTLIRMSAQPRKYRPVRRGQRAPINTNKGATSKSAIGKWTTSGCSSFQADIARVMARPFPSQFDTWRPLIGTLVTNVPKLLRPYPSVSEDQNHSEWHLPLSKCFSLLKP